MVEHAAYFAGEWGWSHIHGQPGTVAPTVGEWGWSGAVGRFREYHNDHMDVVGHNTITVNNDVIMRIVEIYRVDNFHNMWVNGGVVTYAGEQGWLHMRHIAIVGS